MPEELMVHYCAPTLAGLKTGSMFSCEVEDKAALTRGLVAFNRTLVPRGLRAVPLRFSDYRALIYVFRPACRTSAESASVANPQPQYSRPIQ